MAISSAITLIQPRQETLFTWIIPNLAFVGAIKFTNRYKLAMKKKNNE
ncbi:hypothetical protein J7L68_05840 [bacterium]|nr:hypothetical protein [bacterium]